MVSESESNSLLRALKQLYARVVFGLLHRRMVSFRKDVVNHARQDLATPLADHLEKLAASREPNQAVVPRKRVQKTGIKGAGKRAGHGNSYPGQPVSVAGRAFGSLSRYFKTRRTSAVLDPQMSAKLQKSTLSHIHSALRLARQGEITTARLHADIASHALQEAGHYMSEQEYARFSLEVDEKLGEIRKQSS